MGPARVPATIPWFHAACYVARRKRFRQKFDWQPQGAAPAANYFAGKEEGAERKTKSGNRVWKKGESRKRSPPYLVQEANLALGGMHVHVHVAARQLNILRREKGLCLAI